MMLRFKRYRTEFKRLEFLDKHAVVSTWVSGVLAVVGLLISIVVFEVTAQLQAQANALQRQTFIREQNRENAKRLMETVRAFALDNDRINAP